MVLRLILHIWSGCGGLLNGVAVADVKRCHRGDAPYRAVVISLVTNTLCCHGVGLNVRAARDDSGTNGIQIQMRQRAHHMSQPRPVLHTLKAVTRNTVLHSYRRKP